MAGAKVTTLREGVLIFVESRIIQTMLTVLLCCDVIMVIVVLALDAEYPNCSAALKVCGLDKSHQCVDAPYNIEKISWGLSYFSNGILFIFVVEIMLTAFGLGLRAYLCTPSYVFDAVIVFASLAVEISEGQNHHDTGLLVTARAWRFISLMHGMKTLKEETLVVDSSETNQAEYNPL